MIAKVRWAKDDKEAEKMEELGIEYDEFEYDYLHFDISEIEAYNKSMVDGHITLRFKGGSTYCVLGEGTLINSLDNWLGRHDKKY